MAAKSTILAAYSLLQIALDQHGRPSRDRDILEQCVECLRDHSALRREKEGVATTVEEVRDLLEKE